MSSYSLIKQTTLEIAGIIDQLANQEIKHSTIRRFWNWFFTSHARTIIINKPDSELRALLEIAYNKLEPMFKKTSLAVDLRDSKKLNSPEMNERLMQLPDFEAIGDLLNEL